MSFEPVVCPLRNAFIFDLLRIGKSSDTRLQGFALPPSSCYMINELLAIFQYL